MKEKVVYIERGVWKGTDGRWIYTKLLNKLPKNGTTRNVKGAGVIGGSE